MLAESLSQADPKATWMRAPKTARFIRTSGRKHWRERETYRSASVDSRETSWFNNGEPF
jgi:hypothetical protein